VTRNQPVVGARALKKSLCFLPKLVNRISLSTTSLSTIQISISRIIIIIKKILFSMTGNVFNWKVPRLKEL
jgi:hypothetical protein